MNILQNLRRTAWGACESLTSKEGSKQEEIDWHGKRYFFANGFASTNNTLNDIY
jgi:hypothetical protein